MKRVNVIANANFTAREGKILGSSLERLCDLVSLFTQEFKKAYIICTQETLPNFNLHQGMLPKHNLNQGNVT